MAKPATKRTKTAAKKPAKKSSTPKVDELKTGTFLDELPMGTLGEGTAADVNVRTSYAGSRSPQELVTIVFRLTMTQPASFQTLAGNTPSAPRTDHISLHGTDHFYGAGGKLRGVMRGVISEALRGQNCHDRETKHARIHCGKCFVCRTFGYFQNGGTSRVTFRDMVSDQEYRPEIFGSINTLSGSPFIRKQDMVPPLTTFWGMIELRNPTKLEIATLCAALQLAGLRGIGSRTTSYGRFQADIVAVLGGYVLNLGGVFPLVEATTKGLSPEDAVTAVLAQLPYNPPALIGADAREATFRIQALSPVSPLYGETF